MIPRKFKIVTNKKVFAIKRKDFIFWNWEGGVKTITYLYVPSIRVPRETFETEREARDYIKKKYGSSGTKLIVSDREKWQEV